MLYGPIKRVQDYTFYFAEENQPVMEEELRILHEEMDKDRFCP